MRYNRVEAMQNFQRWLNKSTMTKTEVVKHDKTSKNNMIIHL